jgi:pSer/pThr/pTyr-binding forkhead associated (FHA) protein
MPEGPPAVSSPIAGHRSTPQELVDRNEAERTGEAHIIYRDSDGRQVIRLLAALGDTAIIGRRDECDISLGWDSEVSRLHASLELIGLDWTIADDGSRNGSFVNGERLYERRRLFDGDEIVLGQTGLVFRFPSKAAGATTRPGGPTMSRQSVTDADRRVLIALCRPLKEPGRAMPASNQAIADELNLGLPAVKKRLTALFARFQLESLPQAEKRSRLAVVALETGIVSPRDL